MHSANIEKLLELIEEIVNADGTWREKHAIIVGAAGDKTSAASIALHEFVEWFVETP